jgi:hypothetical protein
MKKIQVTWHQRDITPPPADEVVLIWDNYWNQADTDIFDAAGFCRNCSQNDISHWAQRPADFDFYLLDEIAGPQPEQQTEQQK